MQQQHQQQKQKKNTLENKENQMCMHNNIIEFVLVFFRSFIF